MNFIIKKLLLLCLLTFARSIFSDTNCDNTKSSLDSIINSTNDLKSIDPFGNLCNSNCPNGYQDIFLMASAKGFYNGGYKDTMALLEEDYRLLSSKFKINKKIIFESPSDLKNLIIDLNRECYHIKKLNIVSHGNKGTIFGNDNSRISITNVHKLNGISCAFSEGAEIILEGCSIANDVHGEQFVKELGKRLLYLNGGTIKAANGKTLAVLAPFASFSPRFSTDFKWKTYAVESGTGTIHGNSLLSDDPQEIVEFAEKKIDELEGLRDKMKGSELDGDLKETLRLFQITKEFIKENLKENKLSKEDRLHVDNLIYFGMSGYDFLMEDLRKAKINEIIQNFTKIKR